jgi:hypothetical protein
MTAERTTRPLICVLTVLCLWLQVLAAAAPARDSERSAEFCAVAPPSSTVLLARGSNRYEHARQPLCGTSLYARVPQRGVDSNSACLAAAVEAHVPRSLRLARLRTGRAPPVIS